MSSLGNLQLSSSSSSVALREICEPVECFLAPHPHAGAPQLLADVSADVVDGHGLQLLVALDLLVDGALAGSQLPVGERKREGFLEDD